MAFCYLPLSEKLAEPGNSQDWTDRNQTVAKLWKGLSKDEKDVFRDPYFFALAKLPDLSKLPDEDKDEGCEDGEDPSFQYLNETTCAPSVHTLSAEEQMKYQPLFDKLVDVEKLHLSHGKPSSTTSVANIQKKSLVELRKAHHAFSVVCQRYQISYYLAAVSCGRTEGWTQVYSNSLSFAGWASNDVKVPQTLASYIHGKSAVTKVEGSKPRQPSDERKIRLGRELNELIGAVSKDKIFPKMPDPQDEINRKGLSLRITRKPGSLLSEEELKEGHRLDKGTTVKNWLSDIRNGLFIIEKIPDNEISNLNLPQRRRKSQKKDTSRNQRQDIHSHLPSETEEEIRNLNQTDNTQPPGLESSQHKSSRISKKKKSAMKRKLEALALGYNENDRPQKRKQLPDSDSDSQNNNDCSDRYDLQNSNNLSDNSDLPDI